MKPIPVMLSFIVLLASCASSESSRPSSKLVTSKHTQEKCENSVERCFDLGPSAQRRVTKTSIALGTAGIDRPIRVGIQTWGGHAGGIKANNGFEANKDSVFWKEYGIEVEFKVIDDYAASRQAFKKGGDKGGIDIMWSTVDTYALEYPQIKDLNPLAFMQYDWSRGGDGIVVSEEIKHVADLKGKRIAVAESTLSHYFVLYLLSQVKLKTSDVSFVFTSSPIEAVALFRRGKVDAAVSWAPDIYEAAVARKGGHVLASTKNATALIADIFVSRGDFAEKHPDLLAKFLLGWFDGVEQVNKNPESVYDLMVKGFEGIKKEDAKEMLEDVKLSTLAENLAFFEVQGDELRGYDDIYRESLTIWRSLGKIAGKTMAAKTRTKKFLSVIKVEFERRFGKIENKKLTKEFAFEFDKKNVKKKSILTKRVSIAFPSGKIKLDGAAKDILDEMATFAQVFGSAKLRVTGNTDDTGNAKENQTLSQKRAQALVDYLVQEHGFPKNKFIVVGAGSTNPVAGNKTAGGRRKNRRTDFEILF